MREMPTPAEVTDRATALEDVQTSDLPAQEEAAHRAAFIKGLRDAADFLESHPTIDAPTPITLNVFVHNREQMGAIARLGNWKKDGNDLFFWLSKAFGPAVKLEINTNRETVCRKVVKGTRVVAAIPERTVEDIEWICDEGVLR